MPRGEGARLLPPWCAPQLPTRCAGLGVTSRAAGDSDGGQCSRTATPASSRWGKDHRRLPRARGGPRGGVRGHCDGDVCGPVRGPAASVIPVGRHRPCHRLLRAERICLHDSLGHTLRLATCGHRLLKEKKKKNTLCLGFPTYKERGGLKFENPPGSAHRLLQRHYSSPQPPPPFQSRERVLRKANCTSRSRRAAGGAQTGCREPLRMVAKWEEVTRSPACPPKRPWSCLSFPAPRGDCRDPPACRKGPSDAACVSLQTSQTFVSGTRGVMCGGMEEVR